jgi:hypothetical protein
MKSSLVFVALLLLTTAGAQHREEPRPNGVIYGIAIGQDGQPAKGMGLTACPFGGLGAKLPHTRTNDDGEYRSLKAFLGGAGTPSTPKMKTPDTQALALVVQRVIFSLQKLRLRPHTAKQNLRFTFLPRRASCKSISPTERQALLSRR